MHSLTMDPRVATPALRSQVVVIAKPHRLRSQQVQTALTTIVLHHLLQAWLSLHRTSLTQRLTSVKVWTVPLASVPQPLVIVTSFLCCVCPSQFLAARARARVFLA